jgi:diaminopimelate decarboxylase
MDQVTLKNLKIDEEEVDGVHFHITSESDENVEWDFTIMKLNEESDRNFIKTEMGYKYHIVTYEDDENADAFEAVLGDLQHHVKKYVSMNKEGFILKKSKKSDEIIKKIFNSKLLNVLGNVAEKKVEAEIV